MLILYTSTLCCVFLCALCGLFFYNKEHDVFHKEHEVWNEIDLKWSNTCFEKSSNIASEQLSKEMNGAVCDATMLNAFTAARIKKCSPSFTIFKEKTLVIVCNVIVKKSPWHKFN